MSEKTVWVLLGEEVSCYECPGYQAVLGVYETREQAIYEAMVAKADGLSSRGWNPEDVQTRIKQITAEEHPFTRRLREVVLNGPAEL